MARGNSFILMASSSGWKKESIALFLDIYRWKSEGGQNFEAELCEPLFSWKSTSALKISLFGQLCEWIISRTGRINSSFKTGSSSACKKESIAHIFVFFPNYLGGGQNLGVKTCKITNSGPSACANLFYIYVISLQFLQSGKFQATCGMPRKRIVWIK